MTDKQPELFDEAADNSADAASRTTVSRDLTGNRALVRAAVDPVQAEFREKLKNFNKILSRKPKGARLIKTRDGYKYYPIGYYDRLLRDLFFGQVKREIIEYKPVMNEITVHARVHYKHPTTNEWLWVDGIAAIPVQQEAKAPIDSIMQTKIKNALQKNLPACYAEAIKNACKQIGSIFGSDLNRTHEEEYSFETDTIIPVNR